MQNKTDASLQILSIVPDSEIQQSDEYLAVLGFDQPGNWEVLVKYNGDIERIAELEGGRAQIINDQFATLSIPRENIANLLNYTQVEYNEVPKRMQYTESSNMVVSCITSVQNNPPYRLKGEGVLLGIIDSGINYFHPDFRNDDGSSRIQYLWDQTITGSPPTGFLTGTDFTKAQIDEALRTPTHAEGLSIVPS